MNNYDLLNKYISEILYKGSNDAPAKDAYLLK